MTTASASTVSRRTVLRGMILSCSAIPAGRALSAGDDDGWTTLLDDSGDLSAWRLPDPNPFWTAKDGVLTGRSNEKLSGNTLYTAAEYADFALEAEARWTGEIDSGFLFRRPQLQLQIGISRSLKRDLTGSFYTGGSDAYPEAGRTKDPENIVRAGEWTKFRLEARGDSFSVWIDGKPTVEGYRSEKYAGKGPIGLQIHGGLKMEVHFRRIRVKPL